MECLRQTLSFFVDRRLFGDEVENLVSMLCALGEALATDAELKVKTVLKHTDGPAGNDPAVVEIGENLLPLAQGSLCERPRKGLVRLKECPNCLQQRAFV